MLALRRHWPLYLMEAAELGAFMLSACIFTVLLFHPNSPLRYSSPLLKRALMGLSMGLTAIGIILSPWGRRSGAHFNPAISLTFYRLGKLGPYDTLFYVLSHFAGAVLGVGVSKLILGAALAVPQVNYAVTVPGIAGPAGAFAAETFMAALLMTTVLVTSSRASWARWTTPAVGTLIAIYILILSPVSGFSINPARTFGSAVFADVWRSVWIYFTAPLLGMLASAQSALALTSIESEFKRYLGHRHLNGLRRSCAD
jgi:aquaporin Z